MERVRQILADPRPVKWLFYGDSITHGSFHTLGHRTYPELFSERVRSEIGRPMDIVLNTAISGNTVRDLLDSFDWRVEPFKPDVVFIMIGMNDCSEGNRISLAEFQAGLASLTARIAELGGLAVLQTTCLMLPGQAPDRDPPLPSYMDAVRRAAAKEDLPLVDHARFWETHYDSLYYWMSNAFHPNEYGHRAFARHLFESMGIFDPESPVCGLYIP